MDNVQSNRHDGVPIKLHFLTLRPQALHAPRGGPRLEKETINHHHDLWRANYIEGMGQRQGGKLLSRG